ncbi:MAG: pyridoxal phosphate-dependent aminotransferase [Candidatus Krumholzibacteriota bacterium]|nr:pyridoxal phosphate-dependent aminotransferase [Candidatus Krumholzibacteriota bacterium]
MEPATKLLAGSGRRGRFYADGMGRLGTETAFEVLARARLLEARGREIVHLEIGEPDFDTPRHIVDAALRSLEAGDTHYVPSAGLPEAREAFADYLSRMRGVSYAPSQVVVTPGAKPILFFSILAAVEAGDEVLYPNPGFPIYESMINFVGAKAVPLRLDPSREFALDLDYLRDAVTPRTRMLILNSPHNPTGGVLSPDDLAVIAEIARENDLLVLSDEVYSRMHHDGQHASIVSQEGMLERTVLLDGASKTYAMTGWRLGFGAMPEHLAEQVARLATNSVSCTAAFVQKAGIAAVTGPQDEVDRMLAAFRERRDAVVAGLNALPGVTCAMPRGAFYAFPDIRGTGWRSRRLSQHLLQEGGVALLCGTAFGEWGEGFIRVSYANSLENIQRALARMKETLRKIL